MSSALVFLGVPWHGRMTSLWPVSGPSSQPQSLWCLARLAWAWLAPALTVACLSTSCRKLGFKCKGSSPLLVIFYFEMVSTPPEIPHFSHFTHMIFQLKKYDVCLVKCKGPSLTPANLSEYTDIVIPGANSTTDVQARISAGESIHVIRGSKGIYNSTFIRIALRALWFTAFMM